MIQNTRIANGYAQMVADRAAAGFQPYLLSFMFSEIGGSPQRIQIVMRKEVERVYATLLTRIVRNPRSPWHAWKAPLLIGCPDWPVEKSDISAKQVILPNDGQHIHALLLTPPVTRLKGGLDDYFRAEHARYVRDCLIRIDVRKITHDAEYVTSYVLKSLGRGRITPDELILLPRALSELSSVTSSGTDRPILYNRKTEASKSLSWL